MSSTLSSPIGPGRKILLIKKDGEMRTATLNINPGQLHVDVYEDRSDGKYIVRYYFIYQLKNGMSIYEEQ